MKSPVGLFPIGFSLPNPQPKVTSHINFLPSVFIILSSNKHLLVPHFVANIMPSIRNTFSRNHLQLEYQVTLDS